MPKAFKSIDEYISTFPEHAQVALQTMRQAIQKAAPKAKETISYNIPTFKTSKNLVHFAGYKHHIGFYPGASGIANHLKDIKKYVHAKGSVQFPIDSALPVSLITKIVKFKLKEQATQLNDK